LNVLGGRFSHSDLTGWESREKKEKKRREGDEVRSSCEKSTADNLPTEKRDASTVDSRFDQRTCVEAVSADDQRGEKGRGGNKRE